MAVSDFIVKTPVLEKSQDYALLRRLGLEHIEKLGHELWTDYNIHDPGITLLELLCYAITDLGYRTGYDIKDLLTEIDNGVPVNHADFHTAREVLTNNPVTFDDLRKLLIDIRGVRNAWIERHTSVRYELDRRAQRLVDPGSPGGAGEMGLNGLFDVFVETDDFVEDTPRLVRLGLPEKVTGGGMFIKPDSRGIRFHVEHELTLEAVSIYAKQVGEVKIRLANGAGKPLLDRLGEELEVKATVAAGEVGKKKRVKLGFQIGPGESYRLLAAAAPGVQLHRNLWPEVEDFRGSIKHLIHLVCGSHRGVNDRPYFFFYDWEVSYAAPPVPAAGADWLTAWAGPADRSEVGAFIRPAGKGIDFETVKDLTLVSVWVYADIAGPVSFSLLDGSGAELERREVELTGATDGERVALGFEVGGGRGYRLIAAAASGVKLFRTKSAGFPLAVENVIRLTSGHPVEDDLYFFHRWELRYPSQPEPATVTRDDVRRGVLDRVVKHRNLCEDLVNIRDLDKEEIAVCADIEVGAGFDVEEIQAEVFYRLEHHISPAVRFYTIEELQAKGKTTDQIFEGPKLDHGFIDDDEFRQVQRRCEIRTSDVVRILMDIDGVLAIKSISLLSFIEGQLRTQEDWLLGLATGDFRAPELSVELSKIVFYKNDLPYFAGRKRVETLLEEKRSADLGSKLRGHPSDLPVPAGEFKDVEGYTPIQNELPVTYGVGRIRIPESKSERRKAQARQLRAYLMFFEQLLANYLSQLANVRRLFSWSEEITATYFTQRVTGIADLDDVFERSYTQAALEEIVEDDETAAYRRNRFLDHLIGRFCEDFAEYGVLMYDLQKTGGKRRVIADKRAFLADYPRIGSERGRAYDYRYPDRRSNISGYQRRVSRLLGIRDLGRRHLAGHRFVIEAPDGDGNGWRFVLRSTTGASLFESGVGVRRAGGEEAVPCESASAVEALLDFALSIGGETAAWKQGELIRSCSTGEVLVIGKVTAAGKKVLAEVQKYFRRYGGSEGFHAIEHVLLRKRTSGDPYLPVQLNERGECTCVEVVEPYSFRIAVILPAWPERFQDLRFRRLMEETLRREAPAHVYPKICWISHMEMIELEKCHDDWSEGLAELARYGRTGELPLPQSAIGDEPYTESLEKLIEILHGLTTVYPLARLHDCLDAGGDAPQITLNNTSLGTS